MEIMNCIKDFVTMVLPYLKNYYYRYQNLDILKGNLEELNAVKEDNRAKADVQLLATRKKLKKEVEFWFGKVERINDEVNVLANKVRESGFFSLVGEEVQKGIFNVEELLVQGRNFDGFVIDDTQRRQVLPIATLFGEVPNKLMKKIWEHLNDDRVSKISVCGMGGVGKTAIIKFINNKLIEDRKFNKVIYIEMSEGFTITTLQNRIAQEINGSFEGDDDKTKRARELHKLLSDVALEGGYVLILDDVWENISLEDVGIPKPSNRSKLVITTRLIRVSIYLDCQEVRIPTLSQPDAWGLFLEKVGNDVKHHPDILPIVRSVVDECDGLPLAIVTIASSMKKVRDTHTWSNTLNELQTQIKSLSGDPEKIFEILQFSYDRLGNEKIKLCFLYCALYPEDFNIDKDALVNLWIAEGYVEEMDTMQAEIDRGHTILNNLKDYCLIEDGYDGNTVKMHDVVRDMALRIISSRPRLFVGSGMQLLKIPESVSPSFPPELTTLLLSNCGIESIQDCFEQMPMLRILDLSRNKSLKSLPNSISNLERLTTLLLGGCKDLKEMPSLSKLKDLKKLDLSRTGIEEVPHGVDGLMKLRYLNLRSKSIREMDLPQLTNLTSLQHLGITLYDGFWRGIESSEMAGIQLLNQLEFLEMSCPELKEFNSYTQALEERVGGGQYHYNVSVGRSPIIKELSNWQGKSIEFYKCEIGTENINLPSKVEKLAFDEMINGREGEVILSNLITCCGNDDRLSFLKNVFYSTGMHMNTNIKKLFSFNWARHKLQKLEELTIQSKFPYSGRKEPLEEVIGSELEFDEGTIKLPKLRKLNLLYLSGLKSICNEKVSLECGSIEEIIICYCRNLKRIPLIFPLGDDGLPSPPPSLKLIRVDSKEWWESAEWDQPQAKSTVKRLVNYTTSGGHGFF